MAQLNTLPYRTELVQLPDGDWVATVPTLGARLFRAVGNTEDEAIKVLESILDKLLAWKIENEELPEPSHEDVKATGKKKPEARSLGLQSIIKAVLDGSTRIQPAFERHAGVERRAAGSLLFNP